MNKIAVYIWLGVIAVVCLGVVFVLYDANACEVMRTSTARSAPTLVFDDEWGTQRGYVWKRASGDLYEEADSDLQKVFGYGRGYVCAAHAVLLSGRNAERTYGDLRQCT